MPTEETKENRLEREIMPKDLFEHYVEARAEGYAGGKKAVPNLNISGFKGYQYHKEGSPYYYQDNYTDTDERPGNFGGFELVTKDSYKGSRLVLYTYGGGLTKKGLELGERTVYSRLRRLLGENVEEVRFGKTIRSTFEDEYGTWVYEGEGAIKDWGWEDKEKISLNGLLVHEVNGVGVCLVKGF